MNILIHGPHTRAHTHFQAKVTKATASDGHFTFWPSWRKEFLPFKDVFLHPYRQINTLSFFLFFQTPLSIFFLTQPITLQELSPPASLVSPNARQPNKHTHTRSGQDIDCTPWLCENKSRSSSSSSKWICSSWFQIITRINKRNRNR